MSGRPIGDEALVRKAARSVAAQVTVLVAVAMVVLVALVTLVVVRAQAGAADDLLRSAIATADDVGDPPAGTWLVMAGRHGSSSSPGLPAELVAELAKLRGGATGEVRLTTLERGDGEYRVATELVGAGQVQAVLDLTTTREARTRMLQTMAVASALGLVFAGLLGLFIGRRAVAPLAQALTLQRAFVADAGHELRTPLTLLSTRAQMLDRTLRRHGSSDEVLRDAHGVVEDSKRLGDVIDDLLVAADPRGTEEHEPVDLAAIAEEVADSAQAHAEQAGVRVRRTADEEGLWILGSVSAVRRATMALVDNAIDHTPRGGEVRIIVRRQRREVILAVSDAGPGIAPEAAQRVLRRFDSSGRRGGRAHYGLGLALTHDVANRLGGQLRLVPGGPGATFELVLPGLDGRRPSVR
ncbi:phospho-acceptor domain-containing protein [Kribbella amoyensis]|uniref:Sensor-like histidine kinase SenX3 n=1 Tax=Kribbella amoyensis TaxID=996641 RepID=A0A561C0D2_9ACTN|nr:HAMP domain-containing sensor histidine kinase [Kribbella amoyensis]TWD84601.1 phospho-acceptor domain-containing protein [Kribbella amoyensis]